MTPVRRVLVCLCSAGLAAVAGVAQDPPGAPPQDPVAALRAKELLDDADRATLKTWIDERIAAVQGGAAGAAGDAAGQLRSGYDGSPAFKEAYVAAVVAAAGPLIRSAELGAATRLLAVLTTMNEPAVQPVLLAALKDARPAIRLVAAAGLRNLRVKLARAGGTYVTDTLTALRDAGRNENSAAVLKAIYQALDFAEAVPSPPDPPANIAAVLDVLGARAERYSAGEVTGPGAEVIGIRVGGGLRSAMTDADKNRFTLAVATMLQHAVRRYVAGDPVLMLLDEKAGPDLLEQRNQIELLIEEAEKELTALLSPAKPPELTQTMRRKEKTQGTGALIKIEMNKWADLLEKAVGKRFHVE